MARPAVAAVLGPLIEAGLVATCGVIEFELGWATRSGAEFDLVRADREEGYEWLDTHDEDWHRALDVQSALWRSGHVRAVGFPDLLIAAVAEREQVALLHYDSDYDLERGRWAFRVQVGGRPSGCSAGGLPWRRVRGGPR